MAPDFVPPGDGQDPYTESLDAWLKRQPPEVRDALLGPKRAVLWRAGRIKARDLPRPGGEVLSVAELAVAYPDSAYDAAKVGGRYSSLESTADSFARNAVTLRALGKSTREQLDHTEAPNNALVVSGAKGQAAQQVQDAPGKAMATGSLRGIELNTVLSQGMAGDTALLLDPARLARRIRELWLK